jgi:hypothetical protein
MVAEPSFPAHPAAPVAETVTKKSPADGTANSAVIVQPFVAVAVT